MTTIGERVAGGGDPSREFRRVWAAINALQNARSLEHSSIGANGLRLHSGGSTTIEDGGGVIVRDGGGIAILDGGTLHAAYESGATAVHFGGILTQAGHTAHGLLVQGDADPGPDVFVAKQNFDGTREVRAFTSGATMLLQSSDSSDIEVLSDGRLWLYGDDALDIQCPTGPVNVSANNGLYITPISSGSTANARIDPSTGQLTVVSSSARYKTSIEDLAVDTSAVLRAQPRSWMPGPVPKRCPPWMHEQHADEECHAGETIDPPEDARRQVGFVAEELDELGLDDFVEYDGEGRPDAIRYDRLTAALLPVLQAQQAQIDALTARLDALETQGG